MKNHSFIMSLIAIFMLAQGTAHADPRLTYWPVQETLPSGRVHFKIIEEDTSLRDHQEQISQHVVYDTVVDASEVPKDISPIISNISAPHMTSPTHHPAPRLPPTGNPLWVPVKNAWTDADEDAYSAWFASIDTTFDSSTGLDADCADMGLLFRWVYARNNLLPIANTMAGSGKLFGHFSSNVDWDNLATNPDWKQDERFKAALRYLFDNTFTQTVVADLFPSVVSPKYVHPGSMFMIIRPTNGHTQTIHQVDLSKGITTFWGNEPASETIFSSPLIIEVQNKLTIGMWRQVHPVTNSVGTTWTLTPADQMPGYSTAQFSQTFNSNAEFGDWLDQQLGIQESNATRLSILTQAFEQGLQQRIEITAESIPFCVDTPCAPDSADYNNYSTFARDAKFVSEQQEINALIQTIGPSSNTVTSVMNTLKNQGEVIFGSGLTYLALLQDSTLLAKFNSDPTVSFQARWGIAPAIPNPTLDMETISAALLSLLRQRFTNVMSGYLACEKGCTEGSATVNALSTDHLDSGIKIVFQDALNAAATIGVNPSAIKNIRSKYASWELNSVNDPSCAHALCTFDDVVWGTEASDHLSKWSSDPLDSLNARWGY